MKITLHVEVWVLIAFTLGYLTACIQDRLNRRD
jgi:hypothetical protein